MPLFYAALSSAQAHRSRIRMPTATPRSALFLAALTGIAAVAGVAAIWAGASVMLQSNAPWMALIAALDAALLLRLAGVEPGRLRAGSALAIVLGTSAVAAFFIASVRIGLSLGLRPAEALWRMSGELSWLYVSANAGWSEVLWLLAGCALGWRLAR